ncbi:Putative fluoride ion transporter CrcB 2 [Hyphomicrobiales bacterium]|nr:Putative fluoride ion transporter CrcB 2 [Hyphomicrobiales bacterium]CAH1666791.1 putative fluoride ion transporter CrcB 2 [Hyphomicrobiales bacterium]
MTALDFAWVGLGGGLGSVLRWAIGRMVGERYHGGFPLATFLINTSGAFVIGYLSVMLGVYWRDRYSTALVAALLTGGLGGYTTFSSMQLDAAKLAAKAPLQAFVYLALSVVTGLAAAALGAGLANLVG